MRHNRTTFCKECPFRPTAMKGWLGPHTAEEVFKIVHGEGGYACHMDTTKAAKDGRAEDGVPSYDVVEHCAGAMMHANKTFKAYKSPEMAAHQDRVKKQKVLGFEFLKHHDILGAK